MAAESESSELKVVEDATCTACGCACDDIDLTAENNALLEAKHACHLGEAWFLEDSTPPEHGCTIDGKPASLESGYELSAQILTAGKYPIVCGLSDLACEAQRKAVGIADWIGGLVDSSTQAGGSAASIAMQSVGEVTCTLGEVANRGDFILFWGTDPAESHPRHLAKYSLLPQGMFTPQGREDRTCVVVDSKRTTTAQEADLFLQVKPGNDFEALWTLRALAKDIELDAEQVQSQTGVPLAAWQDLLARMKRAKYGVIFFGPGLASTPNFTSNAVQHAPCEALALLVREMNAFTRFSVLPNRGRGNEVGAENVLTWRTGYPMGVNFSRGYPRYNPGETTMADVLTRGEADCGLVVGSRSLAELPQAARKRLQQIPLVVLNPKEPHSNSSVTFATGISGIHTGGTIFRMDNVPLPLRPAISSPLPSELEILTQIETRVKAIAANSLPAAENKIGGPA